MTRTGARIGFVSTRFAGTDGVSLETAKWAAVLEGLGNTCFYFCGECDRPPEVSTIVPEAHFSHPAIVALNNDLFDDRVRSPATSAQVQALKELLKGHLRQFIEFCRPDMLIVENALALPVNVPLGLALTELIAETAVPTIGHHHDFAWERERYAVQAASDYLDAAFPPSLDSIRHVVINSVAGRQLARRKGVSSTIVPNVMDYDHPPPPPDEHSRTFRQTLGIAADEALILQPTRIVPRKRVERAIEIVRRLEVPAVLVISHHAGDEGQAYGQYLREFAAITGARVIFAADWVGYDRSDPKNGHAVFSLADAYQQCDLVTYPSIIEGFGNAFLEAVYYRRPIMMANYEIYNVDIRPRGFRAITFGEFVDEPALQQVRDWLNDPALTTPVVEKNYELARRYYSFTALRQHLDLLINECLGV